MKTILISRMALPCLLVCFSVNGIAQEIKPQIPEQYIPRENITGVGTKTIVYQLPPNFIIGNALDLESHLRQYVVIDQVNLDETTITIHSKQVIRGEEVNMIFDRLGMTFFQTAPKTK